MKPIEFPEANCKFGPPKDLDESQCSTIHAFRGEVKQGSIDGSTFIVTAWLPDEDDLDRLRQGKPVFISFMGGLPPHYLATSFEAVINFA